VRTLINLFKNDVAQGAVRTDDRKLEFGIRRVL